MISTLKSVAKSLLENHQLLCKAIQFSAVKGLGFNFDPEAITHIFLLAQEKKKIQDCICKYFSTSLSGFYFFISSGFEEDGIDGIDLM